MKRSPAIWGAVLCAAWGLAVPVAAQPPADARVETLAENTPRTTVGGAAFIAPAGWTVEVRGPTVLLAPPEADSVIALVDTPAADADAAVAAAWGASGREAKWPLKVANELPARDGWERIRQYRYEVSANERRFVVAHAALSAGQWTVAIVDFSEPTFEKRLGQFLVVVDRLLPQGYQRESFAGRQAHALDAARLADIAGFVRKAQAALATPGVSIGIVQDGRVVLAEGFGVRELGRPEPVDARTLYMIASNTKAMTTLMLGRLVDAGRLQWSTPVVDVLPGFALGDADTTARVRIEHLVCACTGLPRQDYEWLMEFADATPADTLRTLATMQPTSDFGALFQYSNPLASAGGYVGGHVLFPQLELGAAYDRAMQQEVFEPLGMTATTFDFTQALRGNHATPHGDDIDGRQALANMAVNHAIVPVRPAGGAWSNVDDMLRYVQMELDRGRLPDGTRYVSEAVLDARLAEQVAIGNDASYGMGLEVDRTWGIPVVHHGGSMAGFKSDMMWLPEHGVGAVILTNSEEAQSMLGPFRRYLLEVLFDGDAEALGDVESAAKTRRERQIAERARLVSPADADAAARLAPRYRNAALGDVVVAREGADTVFDLGEWQSPVASRRNDDGTLSFVTTEPGVSWFEFVVDEAEGRQRLVLRSSQQEYVFEAE